MKEKIGKSEFEFGLSPRGICFKWYGNGMVFFFFFSLMITLGKVKLNCLLL